MKSQNIMSGVGNTATGATIFSDNTVSGGPNDVTVSNLVVEQDMRVDGNFEVGTFTIDDLTVNNDLNVTDDLTVGGNVQADYVETTTSVNVHGSLFLDNNIVGNGLSYDRPLKRLRVDNGSDVTDVLSNAVTVTNGSVTNTHDHNKITIANTGSTRVGHIHLTGTELEVGTTTNHPVEILVNNAPVATAQTNGCVRIGPGALTDVAGSRLLLVNQSTSMSMFNQGTIGNEGVYPLLIMGKTRRNIIAAGDGDSTMYYGAYGGSGLDPDMIMCMRQGIGVGICNGSIAMPAITKQLHVFGDQEVTGTTASTNTTTGALTVAGGVGVAGTMNAGALATPGSISTSSTTASTNTTTGALTVAGGVGIGGSVNIGGSMSSDGISTFSGQAPSMIQQGSVSITASGSATALQNVTFSTPFASEPRVTGICSGTTDLLCSLSSISTTGFNANVKNTSGSTRTGTFHYIAFGPT
jgi:hypothetical protein